MTRMARRLSWLFAVPLVMAACEEPPTSQDDGKPIEVQRAAPAPTPAHTTIAAAGDEMLPKQVWSYSPVGKRDPFRSYLADLAESAQGKTPAREFQPTEEYDLGQYRLTALVTGTSQPKAMVEDPKGTGHTLRIGSRLGKNGGRITRISGQGMIVVEEYRDPATGKRIRVPITVPMRKEQIDGLVVK